MESIFYGLKNNITRCLACNTSFEHFETYSFFDVPITNNARLEDCISKSFYKEVLRGNEQYYCSVCKEKNDAELYSQFKTLPPYLFIRLQRLLFKRNTKEQTKINEEIYIPSQIDMKQLAMIDSSINASTYKLVCIVRHHGLTTNRGHYTIDIACESISMKKGTRCV